MRSQGGATTKVTGPGLEGRLIGFGFAIFQFFRVLRESAGVAERLHAARSLLLLGIVGHVRFMRELRAEHGALVAADLIPSGRFPLSVTLVTALLTLLLGLLAISSIVTRVGPFA
jgi:putative membrane protein